MIERRAGDVRSAVELSPPEAAYLAMGLLRTSRPSRRVQAPGGGDETSKASVLSEDEYRELLQKIGAQQSPIQIDDQRNTVRVRITVFAPDLRIQIVRHFQGKISRS